MTGGGCQVHGGDRAAGVEAVRGQEPAAATGVKMSTEARKVVRGVRTQDVEKSHRDQRKKTKS